MSDVPSDCPGVNSDQAGKSSACDGCPNQKICASGESQIKDPAIAIVAERLKQVKAVILVLSGKGGVGKSTVAAQLAYMLAENQDTQVGLLDIDICGPSQPLLMHMQGEEVHTSASGWSPVFHHEVSNLGVMSIGFLIPNSNEPVIWRGPRKNGLIKQFLTDVDWGALDFLIVDCPPGTSDEHLSIVSFLSDIPAKAAIIVTTPHELALLDVRKEIGFCHKTSINVIGVVENMSGFICPHCTCESNLFPNSSGGVSKMCEEMNVPRICSVPMSLGVSKAADEGRALNNEDGVVYTVYQNFAHVVREYFR
jgi:Mrp family chromosome partitioning ATPase